jgi:hypothetical protein
MTERARTRWLDGYVEQLLTSDARSVDQGRDPARLGRYLEAYALNTAGIAADATLIELAGVNRRTAVAYERLLTNLFVVDAGLAFDWTISGRVYGSLRRSPSWPRSSSRGQKMGVIGGPERH